LSRLRAVISRLSCLYRDVVATRHPRSQHRHGTGPARRTERAGSLLAAPGQQYGLPDTGFLEHLGDKPGVVIGLDANDDRLAGLMACHGIGRQRGQPGAGLIEEHIRMINAACDVISQRCHLHPVQMLQLAGGASRFAGQPC